MEKGPRRRLLSILDGLQTQARVKGASVADKRMLDVLFLDMDSSTACEEPERWETSRLSMLFLSAKIFSP